MLAVHLVRVAHVEKAQRFGGNTEAPARTVRIVLSNILGVVCWIDGTYLCPKYACSCAKLALEHHLNLNIGPWLVTTVAV